jgi:hypothetical protein
MRRYIFIGFQFYLVSGSPLLAQISLTSGVNYAQNFNTYEGTAVSVPTGWTNSTTKNGSYLEREPVLKILLDIGLTVREVIFH